MKKPSIIHPDPYPNETVREIVESAHKAQLRYLEVRDKDKPPRTLERKEAL